MGLRDLGYACIVLSGAYGFVTMGPAPFDGWVLGGMLGVSLFSFFLADVFDVVRRIEKGVRND